VMQRVTVCCSVFSNVEDFTRIHRIDVLVCLLQCVAVCCSVMQRVAACCSVLQRVQ